MRDDIKTHYTITIPRKWVPTLHTLANKERMTVTEVIVGALGEELARFEEERNARE